MSDPRKIAAYALYKIENNLAYSNITLNTLINDSDLSKEDKSLFTAIVYGVLERKITLDYVLSGLIKTKLQKVAPFTLQVLRSGLYQIMYMDKIPDSAAVNESVRIIKKSRENRNAGFVNAVLRNASRKSISLPSGESVGDMSVKYSCPEWIISQFISDFGQEDAKGLLIDSLEPPVISIRVNTLKTNVDSLKTKLQDLNINSTSGTIKDSLSLINGFNISHSKLYNQGLFHVQDIASQSAVSVLDVKPGQRVLDLCSAPGGKSFTMAEIMENNGEIVACDLYEHRVKLIESSAKRLGINIIKTYVSDAAEFNNKLGLFDCILCDVPCSGLGVIRRKPEIKYKQDFDFDKLYELQYKILENAFNYLLPGGRLLYSTCTLNRRENENIVNSFLKVYNKAHKTYEKYYMPHIDKTDGFYCALIIKE